MKYSLIIIMALLLPLAGCKEKVPADQVYEGYLSILKTTENMNDLKPYLSKGANDAMTASIVKFEAIGKTADEGFGIVLDTLKKVESCVVNRQIISAEKIDKENSTLNYSIENECAKKTVGHVNTGEIEVRSSKGEETILMVNEDGWKIKEIEVRMDEAKKPVAEIDAPVSTEEKAE